MAISSELNATALVVIDLQAGARFLVHHVFRRSSSEQFDQALQNNQKLITEFSFRRLPIFVIALRPRIFPPRLGDRFAQSLLSFNTAIYLQKSGPSAFATTDLAQLLRQKDIKRLIITGFTTDNGVKKTVDDAEKLDFSTIVVSDATIGRNQARQQATLKHFKCVRSTMDLLTLLNN